MAALRCKNVHYDSISGLWLSLQPQESPTIVSITICRIPEAANYPCVSAKHNSTAERRYFKLRLATWQHELLRVAWCTSCGVVFHMFQFIGQKLFLSENNANASQGLYHPQTVPTRRLAVRRHLQLTVWDGIYPVFADKRVKMTHLLCTLFQRNAATHEPMH